MERRLFIQLLALGLAQVATGSLLGCTIPRRASPVSGAKKGKVLLAIVPSAANLSQIRILDWDTYSYTNVDVPIGLIHSIVQDRNDKSVVYLFEIFGSCLRVNLDTGAFIKINHREENEMFSGHGAQTSAGDKILCTESGRDRPSFVTIREARTLKKINDAPKECKITHQVVALPHSKIAVCGNMAGLTSADGGGLTFFDYEENKTVNRINVPFPVLHLLPLSSTEVIGLTHLTKWPNKKTQATTSNMRSTEENIKSFSAGQTFIPGPLYYAKMDGTYRTLWDETQKDIFLDNFGLAKIPADGGFLSGHYAAGKVILWRNLEIVKIFSVKGSQAITVSADGSEFMAISERQVKVFSLNSFSELKAPEGFPPVATLASYK